MRNHEGYADPTASMAVGNIMREYKKKQKETWKKQDEMKNRRKIYVASKYAGDIERNVQNAISYCRYVVDRNCMPIASHLIYPLILSDDIPNQRELGLMFGLSLLALCEEVWCFGEISSGMEQEIKEARKLGKKVRFIKEVF